MVSSAGNKGTRLTENKSACKTPSWRKSAGKRLLRDCNNLTFARTAILWDLEESPISYENQLIEGRPHTRGGFFCGILCLHTNEVEPRTRHLSRSAVSALDSRGHKSKPARPDQLSGGR